MKTLSVRQMHAALANLEDIVAREGEIQITRRGRPIARVVPLASRQTMPSNADLRASMPFLRIPSQVHARKDRDGG